MTSPSKRKGNNYEAELRDYINRKLGYDAAERAWGSNGKALGEHEEVDLVVKTDAGGKYKIQAKRRKAIAAYLKPHDEVDVVVFREDRGESYVLVRLDDYLELL